MHFTKNFPNFRPVPLSFGIGEEVAQNNKLVFVFALQIEYCEKLEKTVRNESDDSILKLINFFKKLRGFDLELAREAVKVSLEHAGYKGGIEDLLENGVIEIVLSVVKGNPRLFMTYLLEMSIEAFLNKQQTITLGMLKDYLIEVFGEDMGEDRWQELVKKYGQG